MIFWTLELGRYNWASTEDVWCLALQTPYGLVRETFPKDDKPEVDPEWTTPSEVLDIIEARLDSYWISTRRAETKAKITEIRQHYRNHEEELSDVAPPITEYVRADKLEELAAENARLREALEQEAGR